MSAITFPPAQYPIALALSLFLLILSEGNKFYAGSAGFKILASLSFVFGGIHQASTKLEGLVAVEEVHHAKALVAGLVFSLLGDIFLIPSLENYHRRAKDGGSGNEGTSVSFQTGTLFFALAHISYIVAFTSHNSSFRILNFVLSAVVCLCITRWLGIFESNPTPSSRMVVPPEMKVLVWTYVAIIVTMVSMATATDDGWQRTFGAWIFMISDMFVAVDVFGNKRKKEATKESNRREGWLQRSFGWLSYFWAQMLLAGCI